MPACRSLVILASLLLACSSSDANQPLADAAPSDSATSDAPDGAPPPDSSRLDTEDAGTDARVPEFCTAETPSVSPSGAGFAAETTHYALYAETTKEDATELAKLLEASSAAFASWFERPPPSERMKVRYYKDDASFRAGLAADGITVSADAGGHYQPLNKTAYLFKQGNPYYSHVLALHEATHQYHYVTRLPGGDAPFWYTEGHAEYLSRHDWDGRCVKLGVTSLMSWEDLPAVAKGEASVDVASIVGGMTAGTRADAWAIFRYLDTGPLRASFKAYRDAVDGGGKPSFASMLAPPATVSTDIATWLPSAQEPMKPIFTEWIHVGPRAVNVVAPVFFSLALVKAWPLTHFEAKARVPTSGPWTVGAIVSYTDSTHYVGVVHGSDGNVSTFTASGSATWKKIGTAPKPGGDAEIVVDYSAGVANVKLDGASFSIPTTTPRAGLAASDTTASFHDVGWTP